MAKGLQLGSYWRWPSQKDSCIFNVLNITTKNITIESAAGTSRQQQEFYVHELSREWGC